MKDPKDRRLSVGIAHPAIGRGGSEALVMWGVEALKDAFAVSIITTTKIDLSELNAFYGTRIRDNEVRLRRVGIPLLSRIRGASALKGSLFQRAIRPLANEYDVLISAYSLCDFGVAAIHLVDLSWDEQLRPQYSVPPGGFAGIFHRVPAIRAAYLRFARWLARPSGRDLFGGEDLVLAYSHWIARKIEVGHQVRCGVLYPPVPDVSTGLPFENRRSDFVCLGRVSEEKRLERLVNILEKVRAQGHEVRLRVIGNCAANAYARSVRAFAGGLPWVIFEGFLSAKRKAEILASCRYGIHGAEGEGFGIAVAEMVKAGCITFAPVDGGPSEILNNEMLLYRDDEDAVRKITTVLCDDQLQEGIRTHLYHQAGRFSSERYMQDLLQNVRHFIDQRAQRDTTVEA